MVIFSIFVAIIVVSITLIISYVLYMSRNFRYFKKRGIPHETPMIGFGGIPKMIKMGFMIFHQYMYDKYQKEKVYGFYEPGRHVMVIRDLDMIRDICIKNFNSFCNRRSFVDDEPFGSMMTILKDNHWRRVRNTVSPTFSSGKLKRMSPHIDYATQILLGNLKEANEKGESIELKDLVSCYTMDVIASTGFGVEVNSLKDKQSPFVTEASKMMNSFGKLFGLILLFPFLTPVLSKLQISAFRKDSAQFFTNFVDEAMANRRGEKSSLNRQDFLQILVDSEQIDPDIKDDETITRSSSQDNDDKKYLTRNEIRGQGLIFILAGYDTVSTVLSFCLFQLAENPEICKKVQEEVDRVMEGKFPTYETAFELTYLDMCLNETLRMFPPGFVLDRMCEEDCVIQGVKIEKGTTIIFPVMCIHHDPKLWEDPETFNPERFNPRSDSKGDRHPFAFLPFGHGPRNCIGMRLALLEMKIALAAILQKMTPVPCEKSVYPVNLQDFRMNAKDGLWVKMTPRENIDNVVNLP